MLYWMCIAALFRVLFSESCSFYFKQTSNGLLVICVCITLYVVTAQSQVSSMQFLCQTVLTSYLHEFKKHVFPLLL